MSDLSPRPNRCPECAKDAVEWDTSQTMMGGSTRDDPNYYWTSYRCGLDHTWRISWKRLGPVENVQGG